jgi:hypothetical protein
MLYACADRPGNNPKERGKEASTHYEHENSEQNQAQTTLLDFMVASRAGKTLPPKQRPSKTALSDGW